MHTVTPTRLILGSQPSKSWKNSWVLIFPLSLGSSTGRILQTLTSRTSEAQCAYGTATRRSRNTHLCTSRIRKPPVRTNRTHTPKRAQSFFTPDRNTAGLRVSCAHARPERHPQFCDGRGASPRHSAPRRDATASTRVKRAQRIRLHLEKGGHHIRTNLST